MVWCGFRWQNYAKNKEAPNISGNKNKPNLNQNGLNFHVFSTLKKK